MEWHDINDGYRPNEGAVCVVKIKTGSGFCYGLAAYLRVNDGCGSDTGDMRFCQGVAISAGARLSVNQSLSNVAGFAVVEDGEDEDATAGKPMGEDLE